MLVLVVGCGAGSAPITTSSLIIATGAASRWLGVPGELRIHRNLPHTFLSFPIWHGLPEVQAAIATSVAWLEDVLWSDGQGSRMR